MELPLPWFTIYSWSLLMAWSSLITNFCFCLKASNQMLFNNFGFPTKGAHSICWHICKEKEKVVLLCYLPRWRRWILDTGSFTISECTLLWKGKQVYTWLFGLWPSGQGGTCYIFAQILMKRKFLFLIINLLKVIQWVNKACIWSFALLLSILFWFLAFSNIFHWKIHKLGTQ